VSPAYTEYWLVQIRMFVKGKKVRHEAHEENKKEKKRNKKK
jgi:hypothetical protein